MAIVVPLLALTTCSELEPGLARPVCQRRDPSVVLEARPVEDDLVDPLFETLPGDGGADLLGNDLLVFLVVLVVVLAGLDLRGCLGLLAFFAFRSFLAPIERQVRRSGQRLLLEIVDDLRVDVAGAAEDRQAWTLGRPLDPLAERAVPLLAALFLAIGVGEHDGPLSLNGSVAALAAAAGRAGLADLALDDLFHVFDALALVGLGRAQLADLGRRLPDQVAIGAGEHDAVFLDLGRDALGQLEHDRVRIAERHGHGVAGDLGAVTDAVDLELPGPAVRDAFDHVGEMRAHQTVLGPVLPRVVDAQHLDLVRFGLDRDARGDALGKLALRPLDADRAGLLRERHALRHGQYFSSDARHLTKPRREARRPDPLCGRPDRS